MTEKPECTPVHEDFEGIFDEGSRPLSRCAEVFKMQCQQNACSMCRKSHD
jgi:hypothetical protein